MVFAKNIPKKKLYFEGEYLNGKKAKEKNMMIKVI